MTEKGASPPEELTTAMRNALNNPNPTASDVLEAAESLLDRVLRTDCETRESALELLTVDALMTHALLLSNKDSKRSESFAEEAMHRVATVWQ